MSPAHVLLALLVALVWGANFLVVKAGLEELPPLLFTGLRFLAAAVPAVFLVGRRGLSWRLIGGVGLFIGAGLFGLLFLGMRLGMAPGLSSLVMQTQALFTVLLAALCLGEKPSAAQLAGLGLAVAGMGLVGADAAALGGSLWGFALVLGAAVSWSVGNVILRAAGGADMFRLMVWMSLVPPPLLFGLSALFETGQGRALAGLGPVALGAILYNGLAAHVFAFGAWGLLLQTYSSAVVAPFALLVPVFGMGLSAALLGEGFTPLKVAGCLLIFSGVLLNALGRQISMALAAVRRR